SAIAQAGGNVSLPNPIIPGQSFSVVSGSGFGPLTVANGSMGAGYGGNGNPLTYQVSVSFTQNGGIFGLDLLTSNALGLDFDGAVCGTFALRVLWTMSRAHQAFVFGEICELCRHYLRSKPQDASEISSEELVSEVWAKLIGSITMPDPNDTAER